MVDQERGQGEGTDSRFAPGSVNPAAPRAASSLDDRTESPTNAAVMPPMTNPTTPSNTRMPMFIPWAIFESEAPKHVAQA
jgi:hypothetical protein